MANAEQDIEVELFDGRVTLRGDAAEKLREKLEEKKSNENRSTMNNTIGAALLDYFGIKVQ